jgi:ATP-dependent Clp protease ATP-binding subunit ClpC
MYERFTDRARKVLQIANQTALEMNQEYISPNHILIGLIKEGSGVACNVLRNFDISIARIVAWIEKNEGKRPDKIQLGRLEHTSDTKKVIANAIITAKDLNHNYYGTEHLLMGLITEPSASIVNIFNECGIELQDIRDEVMTLISPKSGETTYGDTFTDGLLTINDCRKEFEGSLGTIHLKRIDLALEIVKLFHKDYVVKSDLHQASIEFLLKELKS